MNNIINILVVEIDLLNTIEKYYINSLIKLSFENQESKSIALESLHRFGVIKPIDKAIGEELYVKYFDNYSLEENLSIEGCINNILFLDSYLERDIKSNISYNIESLVGKERILSIKEIKKMQYRIYGY